MKEPKDFPKALAVLTVAEVVIFTIAASVGYTYNGQYSTAPLIGSLQQPWQKKSAFAFVILPTIVIGSLYANVAGKYIFRRIMRDSRHAHSHSVTGWGTWIGIQAILWVVSLEFAMTVYIANYWYAVGMGARGDHSVNGCGLHKRVPYNIY